MSEQALTYRSEEVSLLPSASATVRHGSTMQPNKERRRGHVQTSTLRDIPDFLQVEAASFEYLYARVRTMLG